MPTEAFLKLEDSKKEQILKAAVKEFSDLPYAKVSIFKIAQRADVSRSGFYYYFKDKKDIYEFLLNSIKDKFINTYNINEKNGIEIFQLAENIFDFIADIKGTPTEPFFRRVVSDITPEYLKETFVCKDSSCDQGQVIDFSNIRFGSCKELKGIIFLIASSILYSVGSYLNDDETFEESKIKLYQMFDIIRNGVAKGVE